MLKLPDPPKLRNGSSVYYLNLLVPESFRAAVDRHHTHLLEMASSLEAARLPREEIKHHVDRLIESYREQLLAASEKFVGDRNA